MRTFLVSTFRSGGGRLLAAGLAIAISVGFVVATLTAMDSFQSSMRTQLAGVYGGVGAVVDVRSLDDDEVERALTAVQESGETGMADVHSTSFVQLEIDDRNYSAVARSLPAADLRAEELADGRWPENRHESAIDEATAQDLGLAVGDTVAARVYDDSGQEVPGPWLQITGLYTGVGVNPLPSVLVRAEDLAGLGEVSTTEIRIASPDAGIAGPSDGGLSASSGDDGEALKNAVGATLRSAGVDAPVLTQQEIIDQETERYFGDAAMLAVIVLAFTVISLVVAALVIMNTFDVLIAQRTRQLALLRCLGATSGQIRRLVLLEGALVGGVASLLGTAGGYGLGHVLAAVSGRVPALAALEPPVLRWWMVAVGLGLGLAVTLVSVSLPARKAMRTPPLMAMRPLEAVAPDPRARVWTLIVGTLFFVGGLAGMVVALLVSRMLIAIPAAAVTAIGLIVLLRLAAAPMIAGLAGLVPGDWVPFRLAALNSRKHPGRTATTTIGMVIGVTVVTTMMVGAALAQGSISKEIDAQRPVDMFVMNQESSPIDPAGLTAVTSAEGVAQAEVVPGTMARVGDDEVLVLGVDETVARASRGDDTVPAPGTVAVGDALVDVTGGPGSAFTLSVGGRQVDVETATTGAPWPGAILIPRDILLELDPDAAAMQIWAQVEDLSSAQLQTLASTISGNTGLQAEVGPAMERAMVDEIITTMLGIVLALLAVAIVISVIGVANTLSLSVIERTRESSLLRALGLTRGQMRVMLACEAVQMTVVAAGIGIVAGTCFGAVGIGALLGEMDVPLSFGLPWFQLVLVVVAALLAGLLASILPARRAARLSPTVGLSAG
ncbi:ABC transporter permease [Dietzia sp. PP-33]|jgi:putative ABC transport system permease protein|uniref:ABC transporter permease n=1 Tax=Dietzia sp. PP-33 TaxID=2957500 RepID=UPI0029AE2734|nr:FtsX-like permease family protein [Dietzia sp. PP-33]MDX2356729.1 FtsX-like permease family protein [Dietzia sp. PP-33]